MIVKTGIKYHYRPLDKWAFLIINFLISGMIIVFDKNNVKNVELNADFIEIGC